MGWRTPSRGVGSSSTQASIFQLIATLSTLFCCLVKNRPLLLSPSSLFRTHTAFSPPFSPSLLLVSSSTLHRPLFSSTSSLLTLLHHNRRLTPLDTISTIKHNQPPSPTIKHCPLISNRQQPITNHQQSTFNNQQSTPTINQCPLITNQQPPITNHQQSTIRNHQPPRTATLQ